MSLLAEVYDQVAACWAVHSRVLIDVTDPAVTTGDGPHWLLIRRRISDGEYAFYRAHAPARCHWPS